MDREPNNEPKSSTLHPGSSAADAKRVGGKGDFGVRESDVVERGYTSENTKRSDPGGAAARSGEDQSRVSGAGGNNSGPGSSSGGDIDPDSTGGAFGTISAAGVDDELPAAAESDGTSDVFASGGHAKGKNQSGPVKQIGKSRVPDADARTTGGQGADASANSDDGDDAAEGEVSTGEASGQDN